MTPQERWWAFRAKLPSLTRWQKIGAGLGTVIMLILFTVFVLPFLLPLQGETTAAVHFADANGQFINLNDLSIYYVHDPAPGEAVILVHGFGGATVTWRDIMPGLQTVGYDVYALDLPGSGLSAKGLEIDMSHPAAVEIIHQFMAQQGLEQAHLVGHSMGANVILYFAQTYPEQVLSLTLVDASVQTVTTAAISPTVIDLPFVQRWGRVILRWMIPDTIAIQLKSATEQDEVVDQAMLDDYKRVLKTDQWELAYLALARDSYRNALPQPLENLITPTLIIWGEEDSWIAPDNGTWLAEDIPGAELILMEGVGHLPMHEAPAEFNHLLIEFWGGQP